jgi:4-diphosphocytidyl-2-C-methyl-D-erythritol kinase
VVVFPNCKINLGLRITRKRDDGYHDLETVFYPLPLRDALEAVDSQESKVKLSITGLEVAGSAEDNLCVKAYHLLKKDFPQLPPVRLYLHKAIPMGAGLGGGSSDGAFTLRLLNEKFHLGLAPEQLLDYALQLGSDCPFFIINTPCSATGRGEFLQTITVNLPDCRFMIVHPGIHINTGWAFAQLSPTPASIHVQQLVQQPVDTWKTALINDFEELVCKAHPALKAIKQQLYDAGAVYASMTGSGSCFYGIFPGTELPVIHWPPTYRVYGV